MFQTADSMTGQRLFWQSLEKHRRPPFDCVASGRSATLTDADQGLALIVAAEDDLDPGVRPRVFVQLLDVPNDALLIDATLDDDLHYLRGSALGTPADELAATETLAMFLPDLGRDWEMVESGEPEADDDGEDSHG